ncbi:MAG: hypothetical protein U5Q44_14125 [Dehalococcoidia bacterium]|nr:hypothetical protein [Dehalococcoidia bacterium]
MRPAAGGAGARTTKRRERCEHQKEGEDDDANSHGASSVRRLTQG